MDGKRTVEQALFSLVVPPMPSSADPAIRQRYPKRARATKPGQAHCDRNLQIGQGLLGDVLRATPLDHGALQSSDCRLVSSSEAAFRGGGSYSARPSTSQRQAIFKTLRDTDSCWRRPLATRTAPSIASAPLLGKLFRKRSGAVWAASPPTARPRAHTLAGHTKQPVIESPNSILIRCGESPDGGLSRIRRTDLSLSSLPALGATQLENGARSCLDAVSRWVAVSITVNALRLSSAITAKIR